MPALEPSKSSMLTQTHTHIHTFTVFTRHECNTSMHAHITNTLHKSPIMNIDNNELFLCTWVHAVEKGLSLMAAVALSPNEDMQFI